jgi:hypothetical protein
MQLSDGESGQDWDDFFISMDGGSRAVWGEWHVVMVQPPLFGAVSLLLLYEMTWQMMLDGC